MLGTDQTGATLFPNGLCGCSGAEGAAPPVLCSHRAPTSVPRRFAVALAPDEPEAEVQQAAGTAEAAAQRGAAGVAAPAPSGSSSGSAFPSPVRSEGGLGTNENAAGNARPSSGGVSGKAFGLGFILPQLFPGSRPVTPAAPAIPTPSILEGLGVAASAAGVAGTAGTAGTAHGSSRPQSAQAQDWLEGSAGLPEEERQKEEEEEEADVAAALDDPDAGCILGLFPRPVRQAIVEACLACSSGSGGGQQGGVVQRRLVELCVDKGGRAGASVRQLWAMAMRSCLLWVFHMCAPLACLPCCARTITYCVTPKGCNVPCVACRPPGGGALW